SHADPGVETEAVAGPIAHQNRLTADGECPGGEVGALRIPARVHPEIHEELEAIGEAVPETEVEVEGARPAWPLAGQIGGAAAEAEGEQQAFASVHLAPRRPPV